MIVIMVISTRNNAQTAFLSRTFLIVSILFCYSMMVMFYVKGGSTAKDGQAVAEMLKAKIENEEGFFEFRMLKVEPYSKCNDTYLLEK